MKHALLFLFTALGAAACTAGSGPVIAGGGSSRSGVNQAYSFATLSDSDRGRFCDWVASLYGGYGTSPPPVQCSKDYSVTKKAPKSQDSCVADLESVPATCEASVGDVEECVTYVNENPCATEKNPPACAGLLTRSCTRTETVVVESPPAADDAPARK